MDILLIRFSSLGDIVLATAVVEALYNKYPGIRIRFLTKKAYEPLFEGDDRVEGVTGIRGRESPLEIARMLGRDGYDVVIDLHGSPRSVSVVSLLRSPVKFRVDKHAVARRLMIWSRNRFRRSFDMLGSYLETVKTLGVSERVFPRLVPSAPALKSADDLLKGFGASLVGVAPGARHDTKRWNERSFALLADEIARRGRLPVFVGDEGDAPVVERIRKTMKMESVSFAGGTGLSVTVALVSRMRAFVTNDSGLMHVAGALGVPFVAVFGPTHPDLGFAPGYPSGTVVHSGAPCSPCSLHGRAPCRFERRFCMDDISWELVMERLEEKF